MSGRCEAHNFVVDPTDGLCATCGMPEDEPEAMHTVEKGKRYTVEYTIGRRKRTLTGVYLGTGRIGARGQEVAFDLRPEYGTTTLWTADITKVVPAR